MSLVTNDAPSGVQTHSAGTGARAESCDSVTDICISCFDLAWSLLLLWTYLHTSTTRTYLPARMPRLFVFSFPALFLHESMARDQGNAPCRTGCWIISSFLSRWRCDARGFHWAGPGERETVGSRFKTGLAN